MGKPRKGGAGLDSVLIDKFRKELGDKIPEKYMIPGTKGHPDRVSMDMQFTDIEGEWPVFLGKPGDKTTPEMVMDLYKSVQENLNGQKLSYPIDTGHGAFQGNQLMLGEIQPENIRVIEAKDVKIEGLENLPVGSLWFCVKPEWYLDEYSNISKGKYGMRPSISRDPITGAFLNLALCQVPAIDEAPPIALYSNKKESLISKEYVKLSFGKELYMIQDETLLNKVKDIFTQMGIATEKVDKICTEILDDADATAIISSIKVDEPTEEPIQESKNELQGLKDAVAKLNEQITVLETNSVKQNETVESYAKELTDIKSKFTTMPKPGFQLKPVKKEESDLTESVALYMKTHNVDYGHAVAEILKKRGK